MKNKKIGELNEEFEKSKQCDESTFADQKSNLLLISGDHFKKVEQGLRDKLRESSMSETQKVRIVKNHTQKLCQREINGIAALAPDVKITPANPSEMQDKKAAELNQAVKEFGDRRYKLKERVEEWIEDLVHIGEVACLIRWDKNKGTLVSYHQKTDEMGNPLFLMQSADGGEMEMPATGNPEIDQMLKPAPDKDRPVFSGDFVFERIYGFNLHRDPDAESMDDSYVIIDKMTPPADVKGMVEKDDPEYDDKIKAIEASASTTYRIFDTNKLSFSDAKGNVHLRYHYYRPSYECPNGYYYICVDTHIIAQGELPWGIWPIAYRGHTRIPTSPRHCSRIKVIRPFQVEINRASGSRIKHMLTHGDDKIITRPGAKATAEATMPGIRAYKAFGDVTVIPGRTGDQFAGYLTETTQELYAICDEDINEDSSTQVDPVAMLYSSVKRSKKYGKQARTIIYFLSDLYMIYLSLAKEYFDDNHFVNAVGRNERVNLAEFKSTNPTSVQVKVEASNSDANEMLGRYLSLQQILQYVGKDLDKDTIARIVSNLPFVNNEQILGPQMLNFKNVENDMLALDRGEQRPAEPDDEHDLYIKELTARIKSPDFKGLDPMIQQNYQMKREEHRALKAEQVKQLSMEAQKFIPMGGNFVKCDMYVMKDGKQQRATFPDESLKWLEEKLQSQGMTQETLEAMSKADQVSILQQANQGMMGQPPQQMNPMNSQGGMNVGNGINQQQPGNGQF